MGNRHRTKTICYDPSSRIEKRNGRVLLLHVDIDIDVDLDFDGDGDMNLVACPLTHITKGRSGGLTPLAIRGCWCQGTKRRSGDVNGCDPVHVQVAVKVHD